MFHSYDSYVKLPECTPNIECYLSSNVLNMFEQHIKWADHGQGWLEDNDMRLGAPPNWWHAQLPGARWGQAELPPFFISRAMRPQLSYKDKPVMFLGHQSLWSSVSTRSLKSAGSWRMPACIRTFRVWGQLPLRWPNNDVKPLHLHFKDVALIFVNLSEPFPEKSVWNYPKIAFPCYILYIYIYNIHPCV